MPRWPKWAIGGVGREEAGNRICLMLLVNLLSRSCQNVCWCIMAHVRAFAGNWTR
jgi:hypothetical protein